MNRFFVPTSVVLAALSILTIATPAYAVERAHYSRGTAAFINANCDFVGPETPRIWAITTRSAMP